MSADLKGRIVLVTSFATLILIAALLYFDFRRGSRPGLKKIGEADSAVERVERRYSGQALWQTLESSSNIYDYDIIRTEANSQTRLVIHGTPIQIGENSVVVIHFEEGRMDVNVKRGVITADNRAPGLAQLRIRAGDVDAETSSGLVQTEVTRKGEVSNTVIEGTVKLKEKEKALDLKRGQEYNSTSGRIVERGRAPDPLPPQHAEIDLQLPAPSDEQTITGSSGLVHFVWASTPDAAAYELAVSQGSRFSPGAHTIRSRVKRIAVNLPPGSYVWKVDAFASDGRTIGRSDVRSFSLRKEAPRANVNVTPRSGDEFTPAEAGKGVLFNWKRNPESTTEHFQMARDKDFKSEVVEKKVTRNHVVMKGPIKSGTYYWRVRGTVEGNAQPFSTPAKVVIAPEPSLADPELTPPRIICPAEGEVVDMTDINTLDFRWESTGKDDNYRMKVYHVVRGHQRPVFETEASHPGVTISDLTVLDKGRFLWVVERVRTGPEGIISGTPARVNFIITLQDEQPIRIKK